MKKKTFILAAICFIFCALKATALPGPQLEPIHFDLLLAQQGLYGSNSAPNTYVSTINPARITDKDFLAIMANAIQPNWPAGSQLALINFGTIIQEHDTRVFVVDKTGTNILFDATTGINNGGTNVVSFSWDYDNPVVAGKNVITPPSEDVIESQIIKFRFHSQTVDSYNDISFQGLDISQQTYDNHTRTYSVTDDASLYGDGCLSTTGWAAWSVISGEMTGKR
ncbi:MAG TPA: hypothetical protein VGN23_11310 [Verrucomicrobiae bacterium]|jgi:hypothetical protein